MAEEFEKRFSPRVFFTPKKMGAQTAEANFNAGVAAAEQVIAYLKEGWNKYQVNNIKTHCLRSNFFERNESKSRIFTNIRDLSILLRLLMRSSKRILL